MASAAAHPDTAAAEFELHAFELAYLMALVGVESVTALPDSVLFPKDDKLRRKALADGERRLVEHGWLTPEPGTEGGRFDDDLLSLTAAVADPRMTILTRRHDPHGKRADAVMYFNRVEAAEVVQTERQCFRIRRVPNAQAAFQRVRKMLGVPVRLDDDGVEAVLRLNEFERVRKSVSDKDLVEAAAGLVDAGLPAPAAEHFSETLASPECKGVVSILHHNAQRVAGVRVLSYYGRNGAGWLATIVTGAVERVRVEPVGVDRFVRRLVDRVQGIDI